MLDCGLDLLRKELLNPFQARHRHDSEDYEGDDAGPCQAIGMCVLFPTRAQRRSPDRRSDTAIRIRSHWGQVSLFQVLEQLRDVVSRQTGPRRCGRHGWRVVRTQAAVDDGVEHGGAEGAPNRPSREGEARGRGEKGVRRAELDAGSD